ncbi:hypothetical protein [Paenibacillus sabinae]|uniref:Uncharacterized protein n=1 Tax=Paenibacillus sabinae T27 TaxID=1268072 RepID=X5A2M3_9BACL|nr:hypothetical protein PSAB_18595 [Paenibacillus sabinae T27]
MNQEGGALIRNSNSPAKENIVLFPKTLDYYQIQLTVMLESERYGEAIGLLRFLLQCQGQDERHYEEWRSLLEWLEAAFPYAVQDEYTGEPPANEEEMGAQEMARQMAKAKLQEDADYANKLLRRVMNEPLSEATLLALEQLSFFEGEEVDDALTEWVQKPGIHPILQFRTLQTLRRRGVQGAAHLRRGMESVEVDIEQVPLQDDDFPPQIAQVLERVAEQTETHEPTLYYFAQELWGQFIMSIYGSDAYNSILTGEDGVLDLWAGALHQTVSETLTGTRNEEETRAMYGITESMRFPFEQAYRMLNSFAGKA